MAIGQFAVASGAWIVTVWAGRCGGDPKYMGIKNELLKPFLEATLDSLPPYHWYIM
jgi:hypothetical protein